MSTIAAQPRIIGQVAPARRTRATAPAAPVASLRPRTVASGTASEGRLHLTLRGRVVVVALGLLLAVAGVMGGRAVAESPQQAVEVQTYAVQTGDTMWSIAQGVARPGEDVRDVVLQLQRLNDLADTSLLAGQVLLLPADA